MKIPRILVFILLILNFKEGKSQNYHRYYTLVDSAFFFQNQALRLKADSLYQQAFGSFGGFPNDYLHAAKNIYDVDSLRALDYLRSAFNYGDSEKSIKLFLARNNFKFSKNQIRQIRNKKKKVTRRRSCYKLKRLIFLDQYVRYFNKKRIGKRDSLNFVVLKKMTISKDSFLFDRFYTGAYTQAFLEVLLIHQRWRNTCEIFNFLYKKVEQGELARDVLYTVIERESMWYGSSFYLSEKNEICKIVNANYRFKNKSSLFCSSLGQIQYYIKSRNTVIPIYPDANMEEVDELRAYLFLPRYKVYKLSHPNFYFPTIEQFEKL